jgi:hypothetical protein
MRITLSEIRALIKEIGYMPKPKSGRTVKKVSDLGTAAGAPVKQEDLEELERQVKELSKTLGGKSFTGTKQIQLSSPHIKKVTAVRGGNRIHRDWVIPYKSTEQAVAILLANSATDVGGHNPAERESGGGAYTARNVAGALGRLFYIKGTGRSQYVQIVYASPDDQFTIVNQLAEAQMDPEVKRKYLEIAINILTAGSSDTIEFPTTAERPTATRVPSAGSATITKKALQPTAKAKAAAPAAPAAPTTVDDSKISTGLSAIKSRARTPADLKFWISLVARAANGKIGSDATFLRPALGMDFKDRWNPTELNALKDQLIAFSATKK